MMCNAQADCFQCSKALDENKLFCPKCEKISGFLSKIITEVRQDANIPQENESTISSEPITIESLRNFILNNYSEVSLPAQETMPHHTLINPLSRWGELEALVRGLFYLNPGQPEVDEQTIINNMRQANVMAHALLGRLESQPRNEAECRAANYLMNQHYRRLYRYFLYYFLDITYPENSNCLKTAAKPAW